jgi:hypothetical protein
MRVEGHLAKNGDDMEVESNIVSPGYWRTMGVPVIEGRDFNEHDRFDLREGEKLPKLAIVNRSFVKRFEIGEHKDQLGIRIIGVVENSLYAGPRAGVKPTVYFSFLQANYPGGFPSMCGRARNRPRSFRRCAVLWRSSIR